METLTVRPARQSGRPAPPRRCPLSPIALLALVACAMLFACAPAAAGVTTPFSGDSAYRHVVTLAGEIGPRPMGSPAERRALAYAVSVLAAAGCTETRVMSMTNAGGTTTSSGVAIGIAPGTSGRMIVIGGHIDSAGPDIPGANDDASGVGCVLELARVLASRPHRSTLVFCCWGGEEDGLRGSTYFVEHFPAIDSVDLMLQIDMADGASHLDIDPDSPFQISAPRWLVKATFEAWYDELGYSRLRYPTHGATLNTSTPGGSGSDHFPFLAHGIPAVDFTSDVSYPIHTPQDDLATFDRSGLKKSGDLVYALVRRFDGGVPSRTTESYYLFTLGTAPVFVGHTELWMFLCLAAGLALAATVMHRRRHRMQRTGVRLRWSGLKLLAALALVQTLAWNAETVVGQIRGVRYPWVNNYAGFVVLGLCAGAIGVWFALRAFMRWKLTPSPYPFFLRAVLLLLVCAGLLAYANPELALYGAWPLFWLGLSAFVRRPLLKVACAAIAAYLPVRLIFLEDLGLLLRAFSMAPGDAMLVRLAWAAGYPAAFTLLSLPFAYGIVAAYRDAGGDPLRLRAFTGVRVLAALVGATILLGVALGTRATYDEQWKRALRVEQTYDLRDSSAAVRLTSSEYLDGAWMRIAGRDSLLTGRHLSMQLLRGTAATVPWLSVDVREDSGTAKGDSGTTIYRTLAMHTSRRPLWVRVRYSSDQPVTMTAPVPFDQGDPFREPSDRQKWFRWYAYPDTPVVLPLRLRLAPSQRVIESVEVRYDDVAAPVTVAAALTNVARRTTVTRRDTIGTP